MRTRSVPIEVAKHREAIKAWLNKVDYISIPIKDVKDVEEEKAKQRLKSRDRRLKRSKI